MSLGNARKARGGCGPLGLSRLSAGRCNTLVELGPAGVVDLSKTSKAWSLVRALAAAISTPVLGADDFDALGWCAASPSPPVVHEDRPASVLGDEDRCDLAAVLHEVARVAPAAPLEDIFDLGEHSLVCDRDRLMLGELGVNPLELVQGGVLGRLRPSAALDCAASNAPHRCSSDRSRPVSRGN